MAKILVVEDDAILLKAYTTVLQMEGFTVEGAHDGEIGLQKAEEMYPDLILLDMLMPNLDGIGFLKLYDIKNKHPKSQVVVFSNVQVPEKIKEAMELGAQTYMIKSTYTPKQMVQLVKDTLAENKKE